MVYDIPFDTFRDCEERLHKMQATGKTYLRVRNDNSREGFPITLSGSLDALLVVINLGEASDFLLRHFDSYGSAVLLGRERQVENAIEDAIYDYYEDRHPAMSERFKDGRHCEIEAVDLRGKDDWIEISPGKPYAFEDIYDKINVVWQEIRINYKASAAGEVFSAQGSEDLPYDDDPTRDD